MNDWNTYKYNFFQGVGIGHPIVCILAVFFNLELGLRVAGEMSSQALRVIV